MASSRTQCELADFSDQILALERKRTYQPLEPKALARKLGVNTPQYDDFKRALRKLLRDKVLEFGKNHTIRSLAPHGSITGTFRRISIGGGFVRPQPTDGTATGDLVLLRISRKPNLLDMAPPGDADVFTWDIVSRNVKVELEMAETLKRKK